MKLTKLQRYTAYCISLWEYENIELPWAIGFCLVAGNIGFFEGHYRQLFELLPEYANKKPDGAYGVFWPDDQTGLDARIAALKACIAETAPKD